MTTQNALALGAAAGPNLSGLWELRFDSANVPPASLTSAMATENPSVQYQHDMNAIRWCHFMGVPYVMGVSPIDIVQNLNGKEVLITTPVRNPSRHIYTDGRQHANPETFDPVSGGNSIGHWEGDTLVVDTTGLNERTWIDAAGHPHTEQLHVIERFTRVNELILHYEATIADPGAYSKTWSTSWNILFHPGMEPLEYICQENNADLKHLVGK
jgi:hypothetical protein